MKSTRGDDAGSSGSSKREQANERGKRALLAAESSPAADSQSPLQCAILLAVLPCRPHEHAENNCSHKRNTDRDDDHGCDRHKDRTCPLGRDVYRELMVPMMRGCPSTIGVACSSKLEQSVNAARLASALLENCQ